jgi:hypothetical protein
MYLGTEETSNIEKIPKYVLDIVLVLQKSGSVLTTSIYEL